MFARLTGSAFEALVIFIHASFDFKKYQLESGGYFAFLSKLGYVFTLRQILKKWSMNFFQ